MTTPTLFAKYPTPQKLARAKPADVEKIIKSCGFFSHENQEHHRLRPRLGREVRRPACRASAKSSNRSQASVRKTASVVMAPPSNDSRAGGRHARLRVSHRLGSRPARLRDKWKKT